MHHRYLTRRFVAASIFSPLPEQNRAAIGAQLFVGTAAAVPQLSGFLHPTNGMQSQGATVLSPQDRWVALGWCRSPRNCPH